MKSYETSVDLSDTTATKATRASPETGSDRTQAVDTLISDLDSGYTESQDMTESKETINIGQPEQRHEPAKEFVMDTDHRDNSLDAVLHDREHDDENKQDNKSNLLHGGVLFSTFYGILVIVLGIALPINEALRGRWLEDIVSAIFQVYMYGASFLFLVTLEVYLTFSGRCRRKPVASDADSVTNNHRADPGYVNMAFDDEKRCKTKSGSRSRQLTLRDLRVSSRSSVLSESTVFDDADKMASGARHRKNSTETTLYIRIVFIVLGLAVMVYDGLLIKQLQEGFLSSACSKKIMFWPQYVHVAFLLVQCYFLFKHSELKLSRNKTILRIGFIHVMSTDINVMIRAFITQTYNGYVNHRDTNLTSVGQNGTNTAPCVYDQGDMMYRAAPYLYPCVIEYNFLAAALVYFMYSSLGDVTVYCAHHGGEASSSTEISCQRTHKGLFFGIVLLAGTTVSVILFFAYLTSSEEASLPLLIYEISDLALHSVLIVTVLGAWYQTGKLRAFSSIYLAFEDGILLTSMSLGILFNIFFLQPVVAKITDGSDRDPLLVLSLTGSILAVVAGIIQAWFIVDLSCRSLTRDHEWQEKPGRGCIMFLLLTNLAIWLLKTFQVRSMDLLLDVHGRDYGFLPWQLIADGLLPFLIYYYLFSSAGLARTWHQMYTDSACGVAFDPEFLPKYDKYSKPAKEFEFVRQRRVQRAMRLGINTVVSPVSDV